MAKRASADISDLDQLAHLYGIERRRPSASGKEVAASDEGQRTILAALQALPPLKELFEQPESTARCFVPEFAAKQRVWGVSLQLYELRSERNWGIGDFKDLCSFVDLAREWGADFVGLNPLHAPFMAAASRCSPYEPSNRRFLNPLYIAVDKVDGFSMTSELRSEIDELRLTPLVEYERIARVKLDALQQAWIVTKDDCATDRAFAEFRQEGGDNLQMHALFEVLSETQVASGGEAGWRAWPEEYQRPSGEAVRRFADKHSADVDFHIWLQWLAHRQLTEASERARQSGMRIGLYMDVAVGEALDGSATWSNREEYVHGASVGSPPDPMAVNGQDWRLAAFHPSAIASGTPSPFEVMMVSVMRYAGAVRIDHAAALRRLFLVPANHGPDEGAYVRYPQEALIETLARLSEKYKCLVIGEDLGNLPDGLQTELAAAKILSYRILSYEQTKDGFKLPNEYPALALACVSTHDHQTFTGWWKSADIEMRKSHGLVPDDAARQQVKDRAREKRQIVGAFNKAGVIDDEANELDETYLAGLSSAAHLFVAQTPSMLVAVRLADLTDEKQPTNVPGTSESYPNWRPKLSRTLEEVAQWSELPQMISVVHGERRPE